MNRTNESSLIRSLLGIPISDVVAEDADKRTPEPDPIEESAIRRLNTVAELPDDPVIPALMEIRAACLAGVFPPPLPRCPSRRAPGAQLQAR